MYTDMYKAQLCKGKHYNYTKQYIDMYMRFMNKTVGLSYAQDDDESYELK